MSANLLRTWSLCKKYLAGESGGLSLLSAFAAATTWRNGVALTLHGFEPSVRIGSRITVSGCFGTFTRSILAFGITFAGPGAGVVPVPREKGYR